MKTVSRYFLHRFRRFKARACLLLFGCFMVSALTVKAQETPAKTVLGPTQRPLLLAHYMPWYVAKPWSKVWGWHWTMNTFVPESKTDKRRIASHYTPLIGPYDSGDPDVVEYHLLSMKMAGIDGIVVDWYGLSDHFDYAQIKLNSDLLLQTAQRLGLRIAICYEDQTIGQLEKAGKLAPTERVSHAQKEIDWLQNNWFNNPAYLKIDGKPVLLSFGNSGLTDAEWETVLETRGDSLLYLSEHRRRNGAAGAFDWPIPSDPDTQLNSFYENFPNWPLAIPAAFPRFHDIYAEAKVQAGYAVVPDEQGQRFEKTLRRAIQSRAPLLQVATWNDWGEGTQIEPSQEFAFRDLETTQRLRRELIDPKFAFRPDDLRLPFRLFNLRKSAITPQHKAQLDAIANHLNAGSPSKALPIIQQLENVSAR